jgi:hypothetical protein
MRCRHWEGTANRGRFGEGLSWLRWEASSGALEEEETGTISVRGRNGGSGLLFSEGLRRPMEEGGGGFDLRR